MQNIKPIEDYKKQMRSMKDDASMQEPSLGMDPDMADVDDDMEDDTEGDDMPSYSAEVPNQIEIAANSAKPYMVITNLKKIHDQTEQLIDMINKSGKVEQWAVDHITTSADDIEEVYNYFKYSGEC
jgi:hypothetical protein